MIDKTNHDKGNLLTVLDSTAELRLDKYNHSLKERPDKLDKLYVSLISDNYDEVEIELDIDDQIAFYKALGKHLESLETEIDDP